MFLKRMPGALVAAGLIASLGVVATAPQASADGLVEEPAAPAAVGTISTASRAGSATKPLETVANLQWSPKTKPLCTVRCATSVPVSAQLGELIEGRNIPVNVEGAKNVTIPIRAYAVKWINDKEFKVAPISNIVNASTGSAGFTRINLKASAPPAGFNGGQVMFQASDYTPKYGAMAESSTSTKVEVVEVYTSRGRDTGFSETSFGSDGIFHRTVDVAVPGHKYSVQMLKGGKWITIDNNGPGTVSKMGTTAVQARVPKGTPTGKYRTRIVNVTKKLYDLSPDQPYTYFTWSRSAGPGDPDFNVYTTPGTWHYNGRDWKTSCEKYSSTTRCRTDIYATQITYKAGQYYRTDGYVFNNLTYLPSKRSIWKSNGLGGFGKVNYNASWTKDGRKWRTECDTKLTGRNACRSYIWAAVAEQYKTKSGATSYRVVNKWLFNNIVLFS